MKTTEAGSSSSKHEPPVNPSCTHSRMVEDERMSDGKKSGRLVCMECGTVLPTEAPPNTSPD
ncbi:MAG: hypothetical protein E8D44_03685 [Nitrospira sp.]|jgi:hypothetical protein|nr:MAG: hypothetical protein E8D44_03685 [Nitrospira sp.]